MSDICLMLTQRPGGAIDLKANVSGLHPLTILQILNLAAVQTATKAIAAEVARRATQVQAATEADIPAAGAIQRVLTG